jgi:gliding motility-associated-like protein
MAVCSWHHPMKHFWAIFTCLFVTTLSLYAQPNHFLGDKPQIVADPPAPWYPGQRVRFSIAITGWNIRNSAGNEYQFFHGLGIEMSPCWQNIIYGPPPPRQNQENKTEGRWIFISDTNLIRPSRCSDDQIGKIGYYFDDTRRKLPNREQDSIPLDDNPFNNFGDGDNRGDAPDRISKFVWNFSWEASVPEIVTDGCLLSVNIFAFSDGETGQWDVLPLGCDTIQSLTSNRHTILPYQYLIQTTGCQSANIEVFFKGAAPSSSDVKWEFNDAEVILQDNERLILKWNTPGIKSITRTTTIPSINYSFGQMGFIEILPILDLDFNLSKTTICVGDTIDTSIFGVDRTIGPSVSINWSSRGAFIENENAGQTKMAWNTPGVKTIQLTYSNPCTNPKVVERTINVLAKPNAIIGLSNDTTCVKAPLSLFVREPDENHRFEWNIAGGIPSRPIGIGPHEVIWNREGRPFIQLIAINGPCRDTAGTIILVQREALVNVKSDTLVCSDQVPVSFTPTFSYRADSSNFQWEPTQYLSTPFALDPTASPVENITYTITASYLHCISVDTIRIRYARSPRLADQVEPINLCNDGKSSVQLNGVINEMFNPPFRVRWSPPTGLSDPHILNPTVRTGDVASYRLTVIDSLGCESILSPNFRIRVIPPPKVDAGQDQFICASDTSTAETRLQATSVGQSGITRWEWSPADKVGDPTIDNTTARVEQTTTFTVIGYTDEGCASIVDDSATVTIFVSPNPIAHVLEETVRICAGESVSLPSYGSGAGPVYGYIWEANPTLSNRFVQEPTARPITTTTYSLRVESNDCRSIDMARITVVVKPVPAVSIVVLPDPIICVGDSVQLTSNVAGGNFTTIRYRWLPSVGLNNDTIPNPMARPLRNQVYRLEVIADGCTASADDLSADITVIQRPNFRADRSSGRIGVVYCPDQPNQPATLNATLGSSNLPFQWIPTDDLNPPSEINPQANPQQTTTYTLEVGPTPEGCVFRDSIVVHVGPLIEASIDLSDDDRTICLGETVRLTAKGGRGAHRYQWLPSGYLDCDTCPTVEGRYDTTTRVQLIIREGRCLDSASVIITVDPQPEAIPEVFPMVGCPPLSVSFNDASTHTDRLEWDISEGPTRSDSAFNHTYYELGDYFVSLSVWGRNNDCKDDTVITVPIRVIAEPVANFSIIDYKDTLILPQSTVRFSNTSLRGTKYTWLFGDGRFSTEVAPEHLYEQPGDYKVLLIVENESGCVDSVYSDVAIRIIEPTLMLPSVFSPNGDGFNDIFNYDYTGVENHELQVFDRWGRQMYIGSNGWNGMTPNGSPAMAGTYFYYIKIGRKQYNGNLTLLR